MDVREALQLAGIQSSTGQDSFKRVAKLHTYKRWAYVFQANKINDSEYLLLDGIAQRGHEHPDGVWVTTGFYLPGSVITPHFARTQNNRSIFSLQALTEVTMAVVPAACLDELRHTNGEFREFGQRVVEQELAQMYKQQALERCSSALDRLKYLRETFPNLENLVPHHFIASYLGITKVSFSRLRKRLMSS